MSWVRIWVHLVFSTKNRFPYLDSKELRFKVFDYIKQKSEEQAIWLDCVNGYQEHAHCLISLGKVQSISQVAQLIKGGSAFWINNNKLTEGKFIWQDDYWAVSVGESHVQAVRNYIHKQEEHHRSFSFNKEIDTFSNKYGFELIKG